MNELFTAIAADDLAAVRRLLGSRPELAAARSPEGVSAVLTALYHRKQTLVALLLEHAPPLDLFDLATLGDVARVRVLLDREPRRLQERAPDGFTPLHLACFFDREPTVALLLELGADPNAVSGNPMSLSPIHSAAACGSAAIARRLLDAGAEADAIQQGGWTALHSAARHGNAPLVRLLLDRGADPALASDDGNTAASLAAEAGHTDLAGSLGAG